jgi:amidase
MTLQPRTIQRIKKYLDNLKTGTLKGLRFLIKLLGDSIYKQSVNIIIKLGGIVVEYEPEQMNFDGLAVYLVLT